MLKVFRGVLDGGAGHLVLLSAVRHLAPACVNLC